MIIDADYLRRALAKADAARAEPGDKVDGGYPYAYGMLSTAVALFLSVNHPTAEPEHGETGAA